MSGRATETNDRRRSGGSLRRALAAALAGLVLLAHPAAALAAEQTDAEQQTPIEVSDAVFKWGMSNEANNGAYFGGCNFLVAGKIPNPGAGGQLMPETSYTATADNVTITKPDADGEYHEATWENKCQDQNGNTLKSGSNETKTAYGKNRVEITGGTGTVDWLTGAGQISWQGSWTVAFYGGMTFWYVSDPVLTVNADGTATVTATASGYGSSMEDMTKWEQIEPTQITLADLGGTSEQSLVRLSEGMLRTAGETSGVTPHYKGVTVTDAAGNVLNASGSPQGAFPQSFVDFQQLTGQNSYWYSSGGLADYAKVATPLWVTYGGVSGSDSAAPATDDSSTSAGAQSPVAVTPPSSTAQTASATAETSTTTSGASTQGATKTSTAATQASTPQTVETIDDVQAGIESGAIRLIEATDAGMSASYAWGDLITPTFLWDGDDTGGTVMAYPRAAYIGSFTVADGAVSLTVDTGALEQGDDGDRYLVFFGDAGTTIAVHTVQSGAATQDEAAAVTATDADAPTVASSAQGSVADSVLLVVIGALGGLVLAAAGVAVWMYTRRPAAPAGV